MPWRRIKVEGFSLIELLVTLAIAGVLVVVAAPSLQSLIMKNRVQSTASEFQSALSMARGEAIKRGGDARLTVVANAKTSGNPDWTTGFTVFFDTTSNANGDAPSTDAKSLVMQTSAAPSGVQATVNFNHIIYNGYGRSINSNGSPLAGVAAFGSADSDWICTIISLSGRARSVTVSNAAYNASGGGCPTN
jgi:type IV fimbrial biogenesis protein FimT